MSNLIDRQAAIDFIDAGHLCNPNEPRWSDNEVVNFLKSRPSAQPEVAKDICVPNNDCISRQAAIEALGKFVDYSDDGEQEINADCVFHTLEELPSAQPERKEGRWEMKPDPYGFFDVIPVCSECGCITKWREKYLYCPNCGAKMGGEQK